MALLFSNDIYVISAFWEDRQLIGIIDNLSGKKRVVEEKENKKRVRDREKTH